jgi:phenazine biosynthesis protein PhzF family protein
VSRPREFKQVDVFASAPFLGNPLAAVVDGTDLPAELMQRFARWTNLSETVFLLPPSSPDADYAVRIFTPFQELPFAGHPTLGAARAWLDSGGTPRARGRIVQECGAGLVPIVCDGADLAFQAPATRRSGPIEEDRLAEIAAALGVDAGRILDHQWVDDGPGWAAVEVSSAEEVLALEPDFSGLPEAMVGVVGARGRRGPGEAAYEVRAFAPGAGVAEDPVTGSLNASIGQWFLARGDVPLPYTVSQGARVGRAGLLTVSHVEGAVWVGGAAITRIVGEVAM